VQCETFGQPASVLTSFLHLDFMPDGQVRIDDGALFGHFTHDQPFIVQVRLKIGPSVGTADIALAGDGASGTATHTIPTALRNLARQFGAVRVWIGSPHVGTVIATNIPVTRDKNGARVRHPACRAHVGLVGLSGKPGRPSWIASTRPHATTSSPRDKAVRRARVRRGEFARS
jgi:hypothetical protein